MQHASPSMSGWQRRLSAVECASLPSHPQGRHEGSGPPAASPLAKRRPASRTGSRSGRSRRGGVGSDETMCEMISAGSPPSKGRWRVMRLVQRTLALQPSLEKVHAPARAGGGVRLRAVGRQAQLRRRLAARFDGERSTRPKDRSRLPSAGRLRRRGFPAGSGRRGAGRRRARPPAAAPYAFRLDQAGGGYVGELPVRAWSARAPLAANGVVYAGRPSCRPTARIGSKCG